MRLKELEGVLQQVETFSSPKVQLEQYATSAQLAAHILYTAENSYADVGGKMVADLGCGSGVFAIGARCLEAAVCVGFDIDADALAVATRNLDDFDMDRVELVRCDVTADQAEVDSGSDDEDEDEDGCDSDDVAAVDDATPTVVRADGHATVDSGAAGERPARNGSEGAMQPSPPPQTRGGQWRRWTKQFDTVFLNPPFGTKSNAGVDVAFVTRAVQLSRGAVYSLHKTSTRKFLTRLAAETLRVPCEVVAELKFDLPKTYKFHRRKSVDVAVDLLRFDCSAT